MLVPDRELKAFGFNLQRFGFDSDREAKKRQNVLFFFFYLGATSEDRCAFCKKTPIKTAAQPKNGHKNLDAFPPSRPSEG